MGHPADDTQLFNVALDHARSLLRTLGAQRDDLSRVAPREQEGAARLARAAQAAAEVRRALEAILPHRAGPENQP